MHEFSICQALLIQVEEIARAKGAETVDRITIECGLLAGVEPGLLLNAFTVMRRGGIAARAELSVKRIGVRIECRNCGALTDTRANRLVCGECGGFRTRVIRGDELRLRHVEMRTAGQGAAGLGTAGQGAAVPAVTSAV